MYTTEYISKYITAIEGPRGDILKKINTWVSNGWNLTDKFIQIAGGGNSGWYTMFYDFSLDHKNEVQDTGL